MHPPLLTHRHSPSSSAERVGGERKASLGGGAEVRIAAVWAFVLSLLRILSLSLCLSPARRDTHVPVPWQQDTLYPNHIEPAVLFRIIRVEAPTATAIFCCREEAKFVGGGSSFSFVSQ